MTVGRAALLAQLEDGHAGTVHLYCLVELEDCSYCSTTVACNHDRQGKHGHSGQLNK
jgi:hypothetical protein